MIKLFPKFLHSISRSHKFSFSQISGDLYTWGNYSEGTGFSDPSTSALVRQPRKLSVFNGNVTKVSMGRYHSAVITNDGTLYTFGNGKKGELGHNDGLTSHSPRPVDFFVKNNKKVIDVCCSGDQTVALTEDGDLWTFGKISYNTLQRFIPSWADGDYKKYLAPTKISELAGKKIISVTSGDGFITVLTDKNEVFQWGRGDEGNFGEGSVSHHNSPHLNHTLEILSQKKHVKPIKIKSCAFSTLVMLSDGKLLGTGNNINGQLGIRHNIGITLDERVENFTPVVDENYHGKKIKDFDLGETSLLLLTEDNKVYFSGLALVYKPSEWYLPTKAKITKLIASSETFGVLTEDNKIYAFNENLVENSEYDIRNNVWQVNNNSFGNGKILDIGGGHQIHYAIVKH